MLAFAVTGWMSLRTRHLHRWVMGGIAVCWLGIGPLKGEAGWCPLTDLQWKLRGAMGVTAPDTSYTASLFAAFNPQYIDIAATGAFVVIICLCLLHWQLERDSYA